jgi:hypothetical protein
MGVKRGLSHQGKNIDCGYLRKKYWEEYLDLRRMKDGEKYIIRSFIIFAPSQILS